MRAKKEFGVNLDKLTTQLADNAYRLRSFVQGIPPEQASWKQTPTEWSMLEVINHLYDEELWDFRVRLDYILHHPTQPWPAINPQGWVTEHNYNQQPFQESLDNFLAARQESLDWLLSLPEPDWEAVYDAPFGPITAGDMAAAWIAHDLLHLRQLVELHWAYTNQLLKPHQPDYAGSW